MRAVHTLHWCAARPSVTSVLSSWATVRCCGGYAAATALVDGTPTGLVCTKVARKRLERHCSKAQVVQRLMAFLHETVLSFLLFIAGPI